MLIFKNPDTSHPLSDVHITLETDNGPMCAWFPEVDEYGIPGIPGAPDASNLMDFGIWVYVTGLDYPEGWEPPGDVRWDPPTV